MEFGRKTWAQVARKSPRSSAVPEPTAPRDISSRPALSFLRDGAPCRAPMLAGASTAAHGLTGEADRREQDKQAVAAPWADLPTDLLHAVLVAGGYGVQLAMTMANTCRGWREAIYTHERGLSELVFPVPEVEIGLLYRLIRENYDVSSLRRKGLEHCRVTRPPVPYIVDLAAMNKNVDACIATARILINAHEEERALRYYELAADLKVPEGLVHLANAYHLGCLGKPTKLEEALSLFSQAATSIMKSNGLVLPPNLDKMANPKGYFKISPLDSWLLGRAAAILAFNNGQSGFVGSSGEDQRKRTYWMKVTSCTLFGGNWG